MKEENKKEKGKPSLTMLLKEARLKGKMFKKYYEEMEEKSEKYNKSHKSKINFNLAQNCKKSDYINQILNIAYFYDNNFTGNKDFMHIPDVATVAMNFVRFPIMLATKEKQDGSSEIVGATTMKYEKNNDLTDNPYFPTKNENVIMITGVLSRNNELVSENDKVYGIGKELYKSAIKGAFELNKKEKIRLVCEIDCRNVNSLNSIKKAVRELNEEGLRVNAFIRGHYEIVNNYKKIVEAPTFIVEFEFNKNKLETNRTIFSYIDCRKSRIYTDISKEINSKTKEIMPFFTIENKRIVIYHEIEKISVCDIELEVGTSADGNCRERVYNPVIERTLNNGI